MIIEAKIINQPESGQYLEKIYDIQSPWNSQEWTWIKFINADFSEWCGQFRGLPRQIAISEKHKIILLLTSDYLYQLGQKEAEIIQFEERPSFQNLCVTDHGDFILSDYYDFEKITNNIKNKEQIVGPIQMDNIKFKKITGSKLEFTCEEFLNWERHLTMEYDSEIDEFSILEG